MRKFQVWFLRLSLIAALGTGLIYGFQNCASKNGDGAGETAANAGPISIQCASNQITFTVDISSHAVPCFDTTLVGGPTCPAHQQVVGISSDGNTLTCADIPTSG